MIGAVPCVRIATDGVHSEDLLGAFLIFDHDLVRRWRRRCDGQLQPLNSGLASATCRFVTQSRCGNCFTRDVGKVDAIIRERDFCIRGWGPRLFHDEVESWRLVVGEVMVARDVEHGVVELRQWAR